MEKFTQDVQQLLEALGGKSNITAVTHCVTRMRFVLKDESKADHKRIEQISAVKGMFTNAGQFQVIIGNEVGQFYNEFTAYAGIEGTSKEEVKSQAKQNQNMLQRFASTMAEIFTPILPAIIVGGLILGFRNILEGVNWAFLNGQTITEASPFWNGVNHFLWLPGEAIFHFLPVGVTWSVVKKFGGTQILGIVLGITLVSPQLLNAWARPTTSAAEIAANWQWDFGFFTMERVGYQAQVLPAIFAALLFVVLERWLRKRVHESIQMIVVPFFSLLPAIIAAHAIIGPIGWTVGQWLSNAVNWGLVDNPLNWLFGGLFGLLYAPLVVTGLHHMLLAIDFQMLADFGHTIQWPMVALSNIAQGAAVLGVIILHRRTMKNRKEELAREEGVSIPSLISAWLGVTEPAMFGINLKFMYPFVAAMTGAGLAGMYVTMTGVKANAVGVGGIPGFLAIQASSIPNFLIGMTIAVVVPFGMVFAFRKISALNKSDLDVAVESETSSIHKVHLPHGHHAYADELSAPTTTVKTKMSVVSPVTGEIHPLSNCPDPTFAEKMVGDGVLISPTVGEVRAPFDGSVSMVFSTGHAIGLRSTEGVEVLIHVGVDTVNLAGEHFEILSSEGQMVKAGDLLLKFDISGIRKAGYDVSTPVIVTNIEQFDLENVIETGSTDESSSLFDVISK